MLGFSFSRFHSLPSWRVPWVYWQAHGCLPPAMPARTGALEKGVTEGIETGNVEGKEEVSETVGATAVVLIRSAPGLRQKTRQRIK